MRARVSKWKCPVRANKHTLIVELEIIETAAIYAKIWAGHLESTLYELRIVTKLTGILMSRTAATDLVQMREDVMFQMRIST